MAWATNFIKCASVAGNNSTSDLAFVVDCTDFVFAEETSSS